MVKAKKSFGQNFLSDEHTRSILVGAAEVSKGDTVLEIGPGLGFITLGLSELAKKVVVVEADNSIIPTLKENISTCSNVEVIEGDGLSYLRNLDKASEVTKFVSSLPFNITSPTLHQIVYQKDKVSMAALIIQKEVAERITATVPDSNYLATFLQTYLEIEYVETVDKALFDPIPQVDGAIVRLVAKNKAEVQKGDIFKYSKFLHHGFAQQRKMLNKRFEVELLEKVGIDPKRRAETLSIEEWQLLYKTWQVASKA